MNLYRITFNQGKTQYIVASSFQGVHDTWHIKKDRYQITSIELIKEDVKIESKT
jgi:hypothetical protein